MEIDRDPARQTDKQTDRTIPNMKTVTTDRAVAIRSSKEDAKLGSLNSKHRRCDSRNFLLDSEQGLRARARARPSKSKRSKESLRDKREIDLSAVLVILLQVVSTRDDQHTGQTGRQAGRRTEDRTERQSIPRLWCAAGVDGMFPKSAEQSLKSPMGDQTEQPVKGRAGGQADRQETDG